MSMQVAHGHRLSPPPPPPSQPLEGIMPCVILDPQGTRIHTGELGGSFDFKARVPNWQLGARIQIWLKLEGDNKLQAGDAQSATCEEWCNPKHERVAGAEDHCSWCKCAGCNGCTGSSGLRLGQSCTVPGQITSCWGAKIIEHEWLGQATVRLGAATSDKDFGCNVALPQGVVYRPPKLTCLDDLGAPPPPPQREWEIQREVAKSAQCADYVPSEYGHASDKWYDTRGPSYNCWWYEHGGMMEKGGCLAAGSNFERTAEQACCACGGGSTRECAMGAVFRRRPPGAAGDIGEVSLQFWRAGGMVELEFTGTAVAMKVAQVWGATSADSANRPRWSNSVRFRLGNNPNIGVDGSTSFSFAVAELPPSDELQITCTDPRSPLPPPPPPPPPWPPAPPPLPCVLGAHVSLHELEKDPFRTDDARAYLLMVSLDTWVDNAEAVLDFGGTTSRRPNVLSSWGAKLAQESGAESTAPFPSGRPQQWVTTVAPRSLRFRLAYGPRTFFAAELSGGGDGAPIEPPQVQCDVPASSPPPPHQLGCGALRLSYAAAGPHQAAIDVLPWIEGALLVLRWPTAAAVPRVQENSVHNAQLALAAGASARVEEAEETLTFRLGDGTARRVEFSTPDEANTPPLSLRCVEASRLSSQAHQERGDAVPAEQEYRDCLALRRNSSNSRDLSPPQWCHDVPRASCEAHYYEIPATNQLVRCTLVGGACDASSRFISCVPPKERKPPPPAPPSPPPLWMALAKGECAYLLRPPLVEALSSATFALRTQRAEMQGDVSRCESAATVPTIEYRIGVGTMADPETEAPWHPLPARTVAGALLVDNLHCGQTPATRCVFRLRPAGWGESSRATQAISGLALPAAPANAARLELAFTVGRSVCLSCSGARAGVVADLATALALPRANVRVVEVREAGATAAVVLDLLPHQERGVEALVRQLASMACLPSSDVYGGDITQFLNAKADVLWFMGRDASPSPVGSDGSPRPVAPGGKLGVASSLRDQADAGETSPPAAEVSAEDSGRLSMVTLLALGATLLAVCLGGARSRFGKVVATRLFAREVQHAEDDAEQEHDARYTIDHDDELDEPPHAGYPGYAGYSDLLPAGGLSYGEVGGLSYGEVGGLREALDDDLVTGGGAPTSALPLRLPFATAPPAQGPLLLEEHVEGYEVERL
jgi:hypothetical protein